MTNKVKIPNNAKIKVNWEDLAINYNKKTIRELQYFFAKEYNVDKNNIKVGFTPININEKGEKIYIKKATISNILDENYQQELFKTWLKEREIKTPLKRILALDDKVNAATTIEESNNGIIWELNWLELDNFLSFGDKERVIFNELINIVMVSSIPENQGGKTNLTIDAIKFAFFGNTTKTDKNEEIFNQFRDKNKTNVTLSINIEGEEFIISRTITRKSKKTGGWSVSSKVDYYQLNPDGSRRDMNDEESKSTTKIIKESIGTESDFDLIISATGKSLDKIVDTKPTERGKIFNKLIGLEPIEIKLDVVRKMYNEFSKKMLSNTFNIIELGDENETLQESIELSNTSLIKRGDEDEANKLEKIRLDSKLDEYHGKKITIDEELINLDISEVNIDITNNINDGILEKAKQDSIKAEIETLKDYEYSEDEYDELIKTNNNLIKVTSELNSEITRLNNSVTTLTNSQSCSLCGQSLKDVDNSEQIKEAKADLVKNNKKLTDLTNKKQSNDAQLASVTLVKQKVDKRNRLEIDRDKIDVRLSELRNIIREKRQIKKEYELNGTTILLNQELDDKIIMVKAELTTLDVKTRENIRNIAQLEGNIKGYKRTIIENDARIVRINKEDEIEKVYKIYIEMMGKKGISKLVLRSVLPVINSELYRILDDITDFDIDVDINDKQDVEFYIVKGDVRKLLKSGSGFEITTASLAIRAILGRLSHLPKPNFLVLDEVFGKIANTNLPLLEPLFDRLLDWYDKIFIITHNDIVKDWSKNIVMVEKVNDVSNINIIK